jgi:hypothetical protein
MSGVNSSGQGLIFPMVNLEAEFKPKEGQQTTLCRCPPLNDKPLLSAIERSS